jgi:hypothetical protein
MGDLSWWERHLGGVRQPPSTTPSSPGQSNYGPAVRWQPQYPPTAPASQQQQYQQQAEGDDAYQRVRQQGYVSKAPANVGRTGTCPDCGGSNFFRRRWAHTEAAPLCTDCGFNGDLFTQSGTLLNAVGASSSAPVSFARTDNPGGESHFGADPNVPQDFSWSAVR